jgi:hypothetical protein
MGLAVTPSSVCDDRFTRGYQEVMFLGKSSIETASGLDLHLPSQGCATGVKR